MGYSYDYDNEEKRYTPTLLKTNRSMWKLMILNILTLGIYSILFFIPVSFDLDKAAPRADGSRTMNYFVAYLLSFFTGGIVLVVWHYFLASRIEEALDEKKIAYGFTTGAFWVWYFLGSFILVGPFVYFHKLCNAMNLLCSSYNEKVEEEAKGKRA